MHLNAVLKPDPRINGLMPPAKLIIVWNPPSRRTMLKFDEWSISVAFSHMGLSNETIGVVCNSLEMSAMKFNVE